jgi:class 3 adenylate cyclase
VDDLAFSIPSEEAVETFTRVRDSVSEPTTLCIGFLDLAKSTPLKVERGNEVGTAKAMEFVALARLVTARGGGEAVKSLGDGLLVTFDDPLSACRTAISLQKACAEHGIRSSSGLAFGRVQRVTSEDGPDVMGAVVDRAARLQGLASSGQILVDVGLVEAVGADLAGYRDVVVSDRLQAHAKGLADLQVFEIGTRSLGLTGAVVTPFEIYPAGRMSISDKARFARQARREIKEFGTGLTAFARYFTGNRPDEFKDHISSILSRGVDLNCYGLSPSSAWVEFVKQTSGEDYVEEAARARSAIIKERNDFIAERLPGELRYFEYDHVPEFHGFCIDPEDDLNGQIMISFYLPGMARAEAPVYQIARSAQPELFDKYRTAMRAIEATAEQVDR